MTAATAPSPSPAPSAPPLAHTPSRQSPVDAIHAASDAASTRRQDASTSSSPSKLNTAPSAYASTSLGTLAKPIDLASPPASPTLAATAIASDSTRPLHLPSPSPSAAPTAAASSSSHVAPTSGPAPSGSAVAATAAPTRSKDASISASTSATRKAPPYTTSGLGTPNRLLPPTPLGNAASPSTANSTPSKPVHLPAPYKAPRLAQSGASESFATAYPTQETRQKYASPSKPLPPASGATPSHKRSWQSSGSVDLANKKFRPTGTSSPAASSGTLAAPTASTSPSPFAASVLPTARASSIAAPTRPPAPKPSPSRPLSAAPTTGRAANVSSGITVTNIPKPGSSLSNQAGVGPLNLIPAVSGTQLPASVRDEYLSLLQKSELIDLVKQLEKQLHDLIAAPTGSSTLYRQARIYPNQIHTQIDRLKARQRIETSRTPATSDMSLKDVYSLLNASQSTSTANTFTRTPSSASRATNVRPAAPASSVPRRQNTSTSAAPASTTAAARGAATGSSAGQKHAGTAQNASLTSLINSINAMVRQQAQPARGPNGAPLPPAQTPSIAPAARATSASASAGKARPATSSAPVISPAALRSIVGDGPMPSNAALAAAIAAHFGGSLPGNAATAPRSANTASASTSTAATNPTARAGTSFTKAAADRNAAAAAATNRTPSVAAPAAGPGKDISDKIAAILGSSSSSQTTMLGPQGLPLAPASPAPGSSTTAGALPIGNIAAMLSSFAGQANPASPAAGSTNAGARTGTPAAERQDNALTSLLQHFEEAKRRLPSQAATGTSSSSASANASAASPASTNIDTIAVHDPIAILTGASANPVFTPTYPAAASAGTSPDMASQREASWSPDPEPVIVQGPLGTSTLPSYEDMIVEGLRVMGEAPPRTLFNWMQVTYPLTKKFRPSAHQALQKAFKRGRLLKTGSMYRINPSWSDPGESRKPTRRPQVGRDHPMVTPGLNGEVLAVSPLKDSQAYRNVGDSGLRTMAKGARPGPRPYGQPGAAPLANPASSIFQNGSAASIILEYQKRTGKKLDADSVKQLYQLIRAGPSDGSAEEMLAHLLTQTGYHDQAATATAAAAAQSAAAAMSASLPSYARPSSSMPAMASGLSAPSSALGRAGTASTANQRRMPTTPVAKGPTSLPLPTTSEPTMMQQLASMLNDLSSPINPVLANSLLGQLSSNAAAAAAARAANLPGMSAAPPLPTAPARTLVPASSAASSASSQLASALSSLSGQAPQQDLDSAVSETLAAALQQIGAAPTAAVANAGSESTYEQAGAAKPVDAANPESQDSGTAGDSGDAVEEGIDLAEYEDAIRALTSAFNNPDADNDDGDSEESDVEADERAIAAAEAEPDSIEEGASQAEDVGKQNQDGDVEATEPGQTAQTAEAEHDRGENEAEEDQNEEEDEEEDDDDDAEEQMDLSAVLRQLTASLQAHQGNATDAQDEDGNKEAGDQEAAAEPGHKEAAESSRTETGGADHPETHAEKESNDKAESMDVDAVTEEARGAHADTVEADQVETAQKGSNEAEGSAETEDAASLQAQLEALVASLAANAGNADDDDDDDEDEEDDAEDDGGEHEDANGGDDA